MYMPMSESDRVVKFNSACILCRYGVHSAHIFPFSLPVWLKWLHGHVLFSEHCEGLGIHFWSFVFSMNFLPISFDHCRSQVMSCRVIWSLYVALPVYSKVKN